MLRYIYRNKYRLRQQSQIIIIGSTKYEKKLQSQNRFVKHDKHLVYKKK